MRCLSVIIANTPVISFIAVPGYCTPPVHEWDMPAELSRAAQDLKSISHMHLYTYHPNYVAPDEFSWEAFLQAGRDLEQDLARLAEKVIYHAQTGTEGATTTNTLHLLKHPQRPIIFIAHSLGGVLLKKVKRRTAICSLPTEVCTSDNLRRYFSPTKMSRIRGFKYSSSASLASFFSERRTAMAILRTPTRYFITT